MCRIAEKSFGDYFAQQMWNPMPLNVKSKAVKRKGLRSD